MGRYHIDCVHAVGALEAPAYTGPPLAGTRCSSKSTLGSPLCERKAKLSREDPAVFHVYKSAFRSGDLGVAPSGLIVCVVRFFSAVRCKTAKRQAKRELCGPRGPCKTAFCRVWSAWSTPFCRFAILPFCRFAKADHARTTDHAKRTTQGGPRDQPRWCAGHGVLWSVFSGPHVGEGGTPPPPLLGGSKVEKWLFCKL